VLAAVRWHPPWALVVDEGLGRAMLKRLDEEELQESQQH